MAGNLSLGIDADGDMRSSATKQENRRQLTWKGTPRGNVHTLHSDHVTVHMCASSSTGDTVEAWPGYGTYHWCQCLSQWCHRTLPALLWSWNETKHSQFSHHTQWSKCVRCVQTQCHIAMVSEEVSENKGYCRIGFLDNNNKAKNSLYTLPGSL